MTFPRCPVVGNFTLALVKISNSPECYPVFSVITYPCYIIRQKSLHRGHRAFTKVTHVVTNRARRGLKKIMHVSLHVYMGVSFLKQELWYLIKQWEDLVPTTETATRQIRNFIGRMRKNKRAELLENHSISIQFALIGCKIQWIAIYQAYLATNG